MTISVTGRQHGYGRDPFKWISGLTEEERQKARAGELVLITGSRPTRELPPGLQDVRRVAHAHYGGRDHFFPRVPRADLEEIRRALGRA